MGFATGRDSGIEIWMSYHGRHTVDNVTQVPAVAEATAAHVACVINSPSEFHAHEDHEINLLLAGSGEVEFITGERIAGKAGDLFFLPANLPHRLHFRENLTFRGLALFPSAFTSLHDLWPGDPFLPRLAAGDATLRPLAIRNQVLLRTVQSIYELCKSEKAYQLPGSTLILIQAARLLAVQVIRMYHLERLRDDFETSKRRVLSVQAWIDQHFTESISLHELADMAILSQSQFCAIFTQAVGLPPRQYLLSRRFQEAVHLLTTTRQPIAEIATSLGFNHLAHFSRLFRAHTGDSPRGYRKKHQIP